MKRKILFLAFLLGTLSVSSASVFEYYFENFEPTQGWAPGPLTAETQDFEVLQGKAAITHCPEKGSAQILELVESSPFTAVFLDASGFASHEAVFCEMRVKPSARNEQEDEEFLDFGGAILGFFGDARKGQVQVLSSKTAEESVWISTGIDYALDGDGRPNDWIHIQIRIDRTSRRWALAIDGEWVLDGLNMLDLPSDVALPLFLYGHARQNNQFDDILVSNLPPSEVKKELAHVLVGRHSKRIRPPATHERFVARVKSNASARHSSEAIREHKPKNPVLRMRKIEYTLETGTGKYTADSEMKSPLIAYSPAYDEEGNRKAAVLTIKADIHLEPGVKLKDLKWRLVHLKGWPDQFGETFAVGDFSTGLVQKITLRPAWQEVATSVVVETQSDEPGGLN